MEYWDWKMTISTSRGKMRNILDEFQWDKKKLTGSAGEKERVTSWEAQSFARSKALKSDFVSQHLAHCQLSMLSKTLGNFFTCLMCSQIKHLFKNVSISPFATKNFLMSSFVNLDYNLIKNGHFPPNFMTVLKSY